MGDRNGGGAMGEARWESIIFTAIFAIFPEYEHTQFIGAGDHSTRQAG
jgi:hypothetical protein